MHDSHIHLALSPLKENYLGDIEEFVKEGGKKILVQTTDASDYLETIDIVEKINNIYPNVAYLALGIHPTIFGEISEKTDIKGVDLFKYAKKQIQYFEDIFNKYKDITNAIGETGLDYFEMNTYLNISDKVREELKEIQKNSFRYQIRLALENNLPMSIHSRDVQGQIDCTKDVLEILAQEGKGQVRASFHSYTGDIHLVEDILNMGMYIGFNAIITYPSGESVRDILKLVPPERILFETDGPYLPTQSVRKNKKAQKKYGRPVMIKEIIEVAAEIKGLSIQKMEEISDQNFTNLFSK